MIRSGMCLLVVVLTAWGAARGAEPPSPITIRLAARDGKAARDELLQFETEQLKQRFLAFDAGAQSVAKQNFKQDPYSLGGQHYVRTVWARGTEFNGQMIVRDPLETFAGMDRIVVEAILVPFPMMKATDISVDRVAAKPDDWSVFFHYCEGSNQRLTGTGWGLSIYRWNPEQLGKLVPFVPQGQMKERVNVPVRGCRVGTSQVGLPPEETVEKDFLRYMRSADDLRDASLTDLDRLEAEVRKIIESGNVFKEVLLPERGPDNRRRYRTDRMTDEERQAEWTKARDLLDSRRQGIRKNFQAMYSTWRESFPVERCWPELKPRGRE